MNNSIFPAFLSFISLIRNESPVFAQAKTGDSLTGCIEYIDSLQVGVALDEKEIKAGYQKFRKQKNNLEISLSPSRFYALYKQIFGLTPKHDLQITRIEHAKILLMQNCYIVEQIAEMAGYHNPYHFIRQFKQFTGVTPGKYAKS